ncbi:unnamed protein product [Chrysoparadoxa australica]
MVISLGETEEGRRCLPTGAASSTERLLRDCDVSSWCMSADRIIRLSKHAWMIYLCELTDKVAPVFYYLGRRKRFMHNSVIQAIKEGITQVAIIGGGFDTLGIRLSATHPDVTFIEIDHPGTHFTKMRGVQAVGQPSNLILIPADLAKTSVSETLMELECWDSSKAALFICEGVFPYLDILDSRELLRSSAEASAAGSLFAFSHIQAAFNKTWTASLCKLGLRLSGEPWLSAYEVAELPEVVAGTGWGMVPGGDDAPDAEKTMETFALARHL